MSSNRLADVFSALWGLTIMTLLAATGMTAGFHPAINDVLWITDIAAGIDYTQIQSLHNGFFPLGFPVLLDQLSSLDPLAVGGWLSLMSAAAVLALTWWLARTLAGAWPALVALVALSLYPLFFEYAASPGPDMMATALTTAGLCLAVQATRLSSRAWLLFGLAGLAVGIGALFRYHAIVMLVGPLVLAATLVPRRWGNAVAVITGGLAGVFAQMLVNLLGGFGPLETEAPFNLYKNAVGLDWYLTATLDRDSFASFTGIIAAAPIDVLMSVAGAAAEFTSILAVVALAAMMSARRSLVWVAMLATVTIYVAVVAFGYSVRGQLPVLPIAAVALASVAMMVYRWLRSTSDASSRSLAAVSSGILIGVLLFLPWLRADLAYIDTRAQVEQQRAAAQLALNQALPSLGTKQVFTNDFDFYLSGLDNVNPRKLGGWGNISMNGRVTQQDLDVTSLPAFLCDAIKHDVRVVLWIPGVATGVAPELESVLAGSSSAPGFIGVGPTGPYRITVLDVQEPSCENPWVSRP